MLEKQWRESRENLGDYLDLCQIHSATFENGVLENREVHRERARLKGEGVLIGLTLSGPRQAEALDRALAVEVDGERLFDAVPATWNLLEPSAASALAAAHAEGLGVIVKEALANGRLTDRYREPRVRRPTPCVGRSGLELNTLMRRRTRVAIGPATPYRQPSNDRARRTVSLALSAEPF